MAKIEFEIFLTKNVKSNQQYNVHKEVNRTDVTRVTDKGHLKMNNEKKARTKILKNERGKTFMILFPISIERFSTVLTR